MSSYPLRMMGDLVGNPRPAGNRAEANLSDSYSPGNQRLIGPFYIVHCSIEGDGHANSDISGEDQCGSPDRATEAQYQSRYDAVEITFHWVTALLVITLYLLAQIWSFIHRGAPSRLEMQSIHVSLGICLAAVLVLRIAWRVGPGRRLPPATSGITEIASECVHYALYLLLVTVVTLGFCFRWSQHVPLSFFGWFVIPAPYPFSQSQAPLIGELHYWVATTIVVLAGGHACAALFHHYILHDGVLRRMLPARGFRPGKISP